MKKTLSDFQAKLILDQHQKIKELENAIAMNQAALLTNIQMITGVEKFDSWRLDNNLLSLDIPQEKEEVKRGRKKSKK